MSWRLFLIRHGMTEGNREKRYIGKTDEGVCDEGRRMLERRKAAGEYPEADLVFVSPMRRCLETAEVLYPGQEPVVVEEFRECDFGLFEGKNYRELTGNVHYQAWIDSGGTLPFPEGESRGAFQDRCCAGFVRMAGICAEWERAEEKKDGKKGTEGDLCCSWRDDNGAVGTVWHGGRRLLFLSVRQRTGVSLCGRGQSGGDWKRRD